ncbi:class A beta-lactamase-related serine hydrolase, partial [Thermococcus sp. M36]
SLLGMLQKENKINLDNPVREYLPELKFYNDNMNNQIIVRDLMTHRTGLPRHDYSWYLFSSTSRDSLLRRIQYMQPTAGIREKWQYNNFMFLVQGMIAEKINKKKWEVLVKENIFDKLDMTRSNFSVLTMSKDSNA